MSLFDAFQFLEVVNVPRLLHLRHHSSDHSQLHSRNRTHDFKVGKIIEFFVSHVYPRMPIDISNIITTQPVLFLLFHDLTSPIMYFYQKVLGLRTNFCKLRSLGECLHLHKGDKFLHLLLLICFPGEHKLIYASPKWKIIDGIVMILIFKHFGGHIANSPSIWASILFPIEFSQSEISKAGIAVLINHDVLGFDVMVNYLFSSKYKQGLE